MDAPRASKAAYSPVITQSKNILGRETELESAGKFIFEEVGVKLWRLYLLCEKKCKM